MAKMLMAITLLLVVVHTSTAAPSSVDTLSGLEARGVAQGQGSVELDAHRGPTVLVLLGTQCPISRRMIPRLNELAAIARENDMAFYGVFSDSWTQTDEVRRFKEDYGVEFPLLLDEGVAVAGQLRSGIRPEAFVFSDAASLVYRGRIDNRFADIGRLRNTFDDHDLLDAMKAVSNGQRPQVARTDAVGCIYHDYDD